MDRQNPRIEEVRAGLQDADFEVRKSALRQLSGPADVPDAIIQLVVRNLSVGELAFYACAALGRLGSAASPAVPELLRALKDPAMPAAARFGAGSAIVRILGVESVRVLVPRLRDEDVKTRVIIAVTLRHVEPVSAATLSDIVAVLGDDDCNFRLAVQRTLRKFGEPAVATLREALHSPSQRIQACACELLLEFDCGNTESIHVARDLLRTNDPVLRFHAARALVQARSNAQQALPELLEALTDTDEEVCRCAALCVANIGAAALPAVPRVASLLSMESPLVRHAAVRALGELAKHSTTASTALIPALSDSDADVRFLAIRAVEALGSSSAFLPQLQKLLSDPAPEIRVLARQVLSQD